MSKYKKEVPLTARHKELVALVANHSYETVRSVAVQNREPTEIAEIMIHKPKTSSKFHFKLTNAVSL